MLTTSELRAGDELDRAFGHIGRCPPWQRERERERLAMALRLCGHGKPERAERLSRLALIDVAIGGFDALRGLPSVRNGGAR